MFFGTCDTQTLKKITIVGGGRKKKPQNSFLFEYCIWEKTGLKSGLSQGRIGGPRICVLGSGRIQSRERQ